MIYRRGNNVRQGHAATNAIAKAETKKGKPILVGIARGGIRTIIPKHDVDGKPSRHCSADEPKMGSVIYARYEKSLAEARDWAVAFRSEQSRVPFQGQVKTAKKR